MCIWHSAIDALLIEIRQCQEKRNPLVQKEMSVMGVASLHNDDISYHRCYKEESLAMHTVPSTTGIDILRPTLLYT